MKRVLFFAAVTALFLGSCTNENNEHGNTPDTPQVETPKKPRIKGPDFNADSAYAHIKTQVAFGPRIPGSKPHAACADFMVAKLKSYGLDVQLQTTAATFRGTMVTMKNIFAQYKPERKDRVLLLAHWDTRPVADEDDVDKDKPFDGADDGGSGAAVLLEMARVLQQQDPNIGVDLLLVDAEDGGDNGGPSDGWCLGSQYWANNKPKDYQPRYAILLDMVGGKNPQFPREGTGVHFAPEVVEKVWDAAAKLGYGNVFINDITGETTDDHLFINQYARIPAIDIVHYNMQTLSYPSWHHRHSDNMDVIDPGTLKMVGTVLVDVLYNEMPVVK